MYFIQQVTGSVYRGLYGMSTEILCNAGKFTAVDNLLDTLYKRSAVDVTVRKIVQQKQVITASYLSVNSSALFSDWI